MHCGLRTLLSGNQEGLLTVSAWMMKGIINYYVEFLTDDCVSDHTERTRSMQIDKNFITQTFRMYNFIISRMARISSIFNHESAE